MFAKLSGFVCVLLKSKFLHQTCPLQHLTAYSTKTDTAQPTSRKAPDHIHNAGIQRRHHRHHHIEQHCRHHRANSLDVCAIFKKCLRKIKKHFFLKQRRENLKDFCNHSLSASLDGFSRYNFSRLCHGFKEVILYVLNAICLYYLYISVLGLNQMVSRFRLRAILKSRYNKD